MHISLIILTPILIFLWVYFLIIITENLFQNPTKPLQLNIINKNSVIESTIFTENVSGEISSKINETNNKNRKTFHVPKFMLELYEKNRKEGKNLQNSDVVKSLIPSHSGNYVDFFFVNLIINIFHCVCGNYVIMVLIYLSGY